MRRLSGTRIGWLLPIGAGRVAIWQVCVLAVLATGFRITPVTVTVMAVAVLLVAATSVRFGGLCGVEWALVLARFLPRKGRTAPAPTPVHTLARTLRVHPHEDRVGNRAGIATIDGTDHIAVVRVAPSAHPAPSMLVSLLHRAMAREDYPVSGARLVVWAVPASPWPVRLHWLALRYRAADAPWAALARGGGDEGCRKAVASAAQRLVSDLAGAGCAASVLDASELGQELLAALGASPDPTGPGGFRAVETWRHWSSGPVHQACFTPRTPDDAVALLGRCVPDALFTCTAYSMTRTVHEGLRTTSTVRLGVPKDRFWCTPERAASRLGVGLLSSNGRQAAEVLATLPLA
ncbi:type VII secretion protein EccE [Actinophytocola oryzae]|uniref:type VII secretion protein EccE n=1 Tax=Actinophytocola oryzae TaxID=502181 RepID=UPI001414DF2B|nr:type VII secretion protein EccE [Actinophytocola oryzae]